jgi:hypothetical protein
MIFFRNRISFSQRTCALQVVYFSSVAMFAARSQILYATSTDHEDRAASSGNASLPSPCFDGCRGAALCHGSGGCLPGDIVSNGQCKRRRRAVCTRIGSMQ